MAQPKKLARDDELKIFFEYGINPATRRIIMGSVTSDTWSEGGESGVDADMWKRLAAGLTVLERWPVIEGADPGITIEMSNPGGDAYHMFGIYDRIRRSPLNIAIEVYGYAMSAGSVILQAADKRMITPHATMLLHYGSDGFYGHSHDFQSHAKEAKRINTAMEDIYLGRMNAKALADGKKPWTRHRLQEKMRFDWYITAEEAVACGLADEILVPEHDKEQ